MAIQDMTTQHRGLGQWTITTYNPNIVIGPIEGYLTVGKDFHIVLCGIDSQKPNPKTEVIQLILVR